MIYLALSHDVDRTRKTFQFLMHLLKSKNSKQFSYQMGSIFEKDHYWGFDSIIQLESRYNVKSTFFFLHETLPFNLFKVSNWKLSVGYYDIFEDRIQNIIKYLDENGWEIGLHGSYLSYKNTNLLSREKSEIESILQHKIEGIRQHFLNLDEKTWERQKSVGFKYDASFGYTRNVGFKENKMNPFIPEGMSDYQVVPLAIMDFCLLNFQNPMAKALEIIDEVDRADGLLVLNWHQRTFNTKEFPKYADLYEEIIVECIQRNAVIGSINQILTKINNLQE